MNFEEWKQNKINREEENKLTKFDTYLDAVKYFKNKYGEKFQMQYSQEFDEEKIYFYHLILDEDEYWNAIKEINGKETKQSKCTEKECLFDRYIFSHQAIEISENGNVHIIH